MATYTFSAPAAGSYPALAQMGSTWTPYDVVVPLDDIFQTAPTLPLTVGPFTLTKATSGALPYQLVASSTSAVWQFAAPDKGSYDPSTSPLRPAVRSGLDGLLTALDPGGAGAAKPRDGALHGLRGWLAQALPQTFAESLYLRYGFDPATRAVELMPGMRLRIESQVHQAVDPGTSELNGFVGSGTTYVELAQLAGSDGRTLPGFGPFVGQLAGLSVQPSPGGGAGALDLQGPALRMPYWRLLYPQTVPPADGTGFVGTAQNPVLVGAPDRTSLEAATKQYESAGTVPAPAVAAWFRGRVAVIPEIPVFLAGVVTWVPLGTTIRGVYSGFAPLPWAAVANVTVGAQSFARVGGTTLSAQGAWKPLTYLMCNLGAAIGGGFAHYGPRLDALDLPLVGGDSLLSTSQPVG